MTVRTERAANGSPPIDDQMAALIKAMLLRGDKQSDIAACFQQNGGRIAEINKGAKFSKVKPASANKLPPKGPYPSPYDLWKASREMWRVRAALETVARNIDEATRIVRRAEQHGSTK